MKKYSVIILLFFTSNKTAAAEKININNNINKSLYINEDKYMSPFPYSIEMKCNSIKYKWYKSLLIANFKSSKYDYYEKFINSIPTIVYDFKKNFHKNSEDYFKYLIKKEAKENIYNDDIKIYDLNYKKYILAKYNNPFNKNPFIFKMNDTIFQWKDSKIFTEECNNLCQNKINNILINFNDSFQYFKYLLQKVVKVQSIKIDIKCDKNINNNYKSLTFDTNIESPFDNIIVIKDCLRTYRWHEDTVEILFPDWLNDNLSKNNYSTFLKLLKDATNNFLKSENEYITLNEFTYFIQQELGENILVYELKNSNWENINNTNNNYISSVVNNETGFVEVEYNKVDDYDWENDKDDF